MTGSNRRSTAAKEPNTAQYVSHLAASEVSLRTLMISTARKEA